MTAAHVPRHDLDAEAAVLSAALLESAGADVAAEIITSPEAFYAREHRRVWDAITRLRERGVTVDAVTVAADLKRSGDSIDGGWVALLGRLCDASPSVSNLRAHARIVVEAWEQRRVVELCRSIAAEGMGDVGAHAAWLESVDERLFALTHRGGERGETTHHAGVLVRQSLQKIQSGKPSGVIVESGLRALDAALTMAVGDLVVIAARPGRGKTSLAMQAAVVAGCAPPDGAEEGAAALAFSAEMPGVQVIDRAICGRARYPVAAYRRGQIPATGTEGYEALAAAARDLDGIALWVDDRSAPTLAHMRAKIRSVKRELAKRWDYDGRPTRLRVVVLDYIQIAGMRVEKGSNRDQQIGEFTRGLKALAKDEGVVVMALSQLNRTNETGGDKRPKLHELRESGNIEQDADAVLGIYRPEDSDIAELCVLKQRNGPEGVAKVKWEGQFTSFRDLTESEEKAEFERERAEQHRPKTGGGWKKQPEDRYR